MTSIIIIHHVALDWHIQQNKYTYYIPERV
jgi:hypothetical protein